SAAATSPIIQPGQLSTKVPLAAYYPRHRSLVTTELDIAEKCHFWLREVSIFSNDYDHFRSHS
ncbi:hypothetical protein PanWU01x14_177560, partial [Parasponia andersonii]